jgi:hypothetical protein
MKNAKGGAPPTGSNQDKPKQVVNEAATTNTNIKPTENKKNTSNDKNSWIERLGVAFIGLGFLATAAAAAINAWQASVSRDTEERQLRAYVGVVPGAVENFGEPTKLVIRMSRKNYGATPAYEVGFSSTNVIISPLNAVLPDVATPCVSPNYSGLVTMFPGTELPLTTNVVGADKISVNDINSVKIGAAALYFWGDVCYKDTFGKPHYTKYCWIYKGESMAAKDADECLQHNDSN